ncbi:HAMP domain-containing sensor histidine kinase [Larkinella knui]|uniref:histidine kinase n=1 Tax=Larkinella knui TaxID=2025310 RepID=A0A3P1CPW6_9BACT|nr:HAMP domain-containing sensor histidine kinase [Larkinella knui]RRB15305.1 sensor histidine kinase [Larkinella knui]
MRIRTKLALLFTAITAAVLLFFAISIYLSYADYREDAYYKRLKQQALTKLRLLLEAKVEPSVLKVIYQNSPNALFQEEVAVYDARFQLVYHDDQQGDFVKETPEFLHSIQHRPEIQFEQQGRQVVGFPYRFQGKTYLVTAAAYDEVGLSKLENLRITLIITFLLSLLIVALLSRLVARQLLRPISTVVRQVGEITATNLDRRVDAGNGRDELAELAITFNQMLDRLEQSFDAQKQFVSNVSHELRTPLAAITGELELAANKPRSVAQYQQVIDRTLRDARRLTHLSNGLLDLAKASYDASEIAFRDVRLDELLMDARGQVLHQQPAYRVTIIFEQEIEDDQLISVRGNAYLLRVAFSNLMENGCKFSPDHHCTVTITSLPQLCRLRFIDQGIGISEDDLPHVFTAFYRGQNLNYAEGNGIGLSLTDRIISLHKGGISVATQPGQGTTFEVELPHL